MKSILIALVCLLFVTTVDAATYWISESSNGNKNCVNSAAQPSNLATGTSRWPTQGIECLAGGDTLYILPGAYDDQIQNLRVNPGGSANPTACASPQCIPNGSATAYTTISAAPGYERGNKAGNPIPQILSTAGKAIRMEGPAHHIKFYGLRIGPSWTSRYVIEGSCAEGTCSRDNSTIPRDIIIENNRIGDSNSGAGSCILGFAFVQILNNEIFNCNDSYAIYNAGEMTVDGNWIHDVHNPDVYSVHAHNSHDDCPLGETPTCHRGDFTAPIENVIIRNNYIERSGAIGIVQGPSQVGCGNQVYNNVIKDSDGYSIRIGGSYTGCGGTGGHVKVYNNTTFGGQPDLSLGFGAIVFAIYLQDSYQIDVRNNLWIDGQFLEDYPGNNTIIGNVTTTNEAGTVVNATGSSLATVNFQLIGTSSLAYNQGQPIPTSGAWNVDANGVSRPQGNAWDAGACEWFSGAVKCPSLAAAVIIPPKPPPTIMIKTPTQNPTFSTINQTITIGGDSTPGGP